MKTCNVAVIGAGNWGRNVIRNFEELGVLTSIVEHSSNIREELAPLYPKASLLEDYVPILKDESVHAVAIATPAPTHFEIAKLALEAGKDVFVEKPMTLSSRDSRELIKVAEREKRILMVGHLLLYQPAIQWIKKRLSEGMLGNLYSLHQQRLKLGRARFVENVTWSLGVHDLAVLLYLVDEDPDHVFASGHCGLRKEVEDDVYVHLNFPSGVKAHLHNSWLWPENHRGLTIVGEKGMLVYEEVNQRVIHHRKTISPDLQIQDLGEEIVFSGGGQPLAIELQHFIDCCKNRTRPISDGENGLKIISVLERITEK